MISSTKVSGLSGNTLKIIALIAMTLDHVGLSFFPEVRLFRILGRFAYPIFAYMISEGCRYTRNKTRYLATIGIVAFLCQLVYFVAMQSLYMCIFVTFFLSIVMIYTFDFALKSKKLYAAFASAFLFALILFLTEFLPKMLPKTDFYIDYGIFGVLVPVLVYFAEGKAMKLIALSVGLLSLAFYYGGTQWFFLLTIPLIALYSGQRGKLRLKWLFYVYYPLHLAVIYFISSVYN